MTSSKYLGQGWGRKEDYSIEANIESAIFSSFRAIFVLE